MPRCKKCRKALGFSPSESAAQKYGGDWYCNKCYNDEFGKKDELDIFFTRLKAKYEREFRETGKITSAWPWELEDSPEFPQNIDKTSLCPICKLKINEIDDYELCKECYSKFHWVCIRKWLEQKKTCPLCNSIWIGPV